ncbi:hypothetical protein [Streptomyces sp. SLBN-118]|uniref:hypothetical protein n=1 Tax=Streptomyces sp. SLBN-118 TaxID=2768454 RepID=UPI00115281AD|nr:hypothetical protein [Streptomyces sp. SLBN-118]
MNVASPGQGRTLTVFRHYTNLTTGQLGFFAEEIRDHSRQMVVALPFNRFIGRLPPIHPRPFLKAVPQPMVTGAVILLYRV